MCLSSHITSPPSLLQRTDFPLCVAHSAALTSFLLRPPLRCRTMRALYLHTGCPRLMQHLHLISPDDGVVSQLPATHLLPRSHCTRGQGAAVVSQFPAFRPTLAQSVSPCRLDSFCGFSLSEPTHTGTRHDVRAQGLTSEVRRPRGSRRFFGREYEVERGRKGNRSIICEASKHNDERGSSREWMARANPYTVLGISPDCSEEDVKAAFRNRVKEYHPDVYKGSQDADAIIQQIFRAYELLTNESVQTLYRRRSKLFHSDPEDVETLSRRNVDPFEDPECEAEDVFVYELDCIGRGCPYPCVGRAPDIFTFNTNTGCARAVSQSGPGQGEDYGVQLAVGQCPRSCIYWVTPLQRAVLEDLLRRALEGTTYSSDVVMLEALIARANYENGRYQPPKQKRKPTVSDQWVDWY